MRRRHTKHAHWFFLLLWLEMLLLLLLFLFCEVLLCLFFSIIPFVFQTSFNRWLQTNEWASLTKWNMFSEALSNVSNWEISEKKIETYNRLICCKKKYLSLYDKPLVLGCALLQLHFSTVHLQPMAWHAVIVTSFLQFLYTQFHLMDLIVWIR